MSKFADVFTKVQEKNKSRTSRASKGVLSFSKIPSEQIQSQEAAWEHRITTVKNTTPQEHVVMLKHPESMPAEQYRMLRTSLKAELLKHHAKVMIVTSSLHAEGKTVSCTNLAVSLAEDRETKVLLIDADLRRGHVAQYLGFGRAKGLTEMFTEDLHPKKIMMKNSLPNLTIIPSGAAHKKPSELINSDKFQTLIASLRNHFDYIIIDSPPVMAAADTCMLSRVADCVIFVVQLGRTPKPVISHAHQLLEQAGAKILGQILTYVEYSTSEYRYYEYYGYGESKAQNPELIPLKRYALQLRDLEAKFNHWWEKRILKKREEKRK